MEIHTDGRPILRFSLFEAWWHNKQEAMKRYFPSEPEKFSNKYMRFGSYVAEELEKRPIPEWLNIPVVDLKGKPSDVPIAYDVNEYRIIHEYEGILIRGSIDSYDTPTHRFLDNKSVKKVWTQGKVNKHIQLPFYSVLIEDHNGFVEDICHIVCLPTGVDEEGNVRLTGEPAVAIARTITADERKEMREKMIDTAKDITVCWEAYKRGDIILDLN